MLSAAPLPSSALHAHALYERSRVIFRSTPPPLKAWHGNDCFARELGRFHGCSYLCFSLSPSVFTSLCRSYSPLLSLSCCFRTIDNNIPEHLSSLVSSLSRFIFFVATLPDSNHPTHMTRKTPLTRMVAGKARHTPSRTNFRTDFFDNGRVQTPRLCIYREIFSAAAIFGVCVPVPRRKHAI